MKIKINWGTAMVIVLVVFMIFILQYTYRATFIEKYNHHLVADDYYKDELNYQTVIDKENASNKLKENIKLVKTEKGLTILFPKNIDFNKITGTINLLRPSNYKLDLKNKIKLNSNTFLIEDKNLAIGKYEVSVDWKYNSKSYLYKTTFYY
jgi:hypothetical protein